MKHHLEADNILAENQFGLRSNHFCESQLLITIDDFAKAVDQKLQEPLTKYHTPDYYTNWDPREMFKHFI